MLEFATATLIQPSDCAPSRRRCTATDWPLTLRFAPRSLLWIVHLLQPELTPRHYLKNTDFPGSHACSRDDGPLI
jgi:hypothetical protein